MMNIMGAYGLAFEFLDYTRIHAPQYLEKFEAQLPEAIQKHAFTALRYCTRFILNNNFDLAEKYFFLARSLHPSIVTDPIAINLSNILFEGDINLRKVKVSKIKDTPDLIARNTSYEPPIPFKTLI